MRTVLAVLVEQSGLNVDCAGCLGRTEWVECVLCCFGKTLILMVAKD